MLSAAAFQAERRDLILFRTVSKQAKRRNQAKEDKTNLQRQGSATLKL